MPSCGAETHLFLAPAALIWRNRGFLAGCAARDEENDKRRIERRKRARGWSSHPCIVPAGVCGARRRKLFLFKANIASQRMENLSHFAVAAALLLMTDTSLKNRLWFLSYVQSGEEFHSRLDAVSSLEDSHGGGERR